jgi:hypothetical protein
MPPLHGTVAAPMATHGVVAYVSCLGGENSCRLRIYKHRHRADG